MGSHPLSDHDVATRGPGSAGSRSGSTEVSREIPGGRRGIVGALERSWGGCGIPWTLALAPGSALYALGSAGARARAKRSRRPVPGLRVIAVGGLTVGGAGKTSVARWLAREALARGDRPAILLRGHRARPGRTPFVLPDAAGYPLGRAVARGGDEAASHRVALPRGASVAAHPDRRRAATLAARGYGATVAILDDGWEQGSLQWDALWVALDPRRPAGNGAILPAGPLRRPASTLREAGVCCLVLDEADETVPAATMEWIRRHAPAAIPLRFRRVLEDGPWNEEPAALVSGVGAPRRVERFVRGAGIHVVFHAAFPDHATWSPADASSVCHEAATAGARVLLLTEKDEPRWPAGATPGLPIRVLRTALVPLDPVDGPLASVLPRVAPSGPIG